MCAGALIFRAYQIGIAPKQWAPQSNLEETLLLDEKTGTKYQMKTQCESHKLEADEYARCSGKIIQTFNFESSLIQQTADEEQFIFRQHKF